MMVNIAIIGAGINGASTGYLLKCRYPSVNVTIISKTFSPNTTSDGAAGFWEPLMAGNTPEDLIKKWSKDTFEHVMNFIKTNPRSSAMGLMTTHGYQLFETEDFEKPYWADIPYDYHKLTKKDLERFPDYLKSGFGFTTVFIEASMLIPWYTRKFEELGGKLVQRELKSLSEIADDYDVVVNCSGLEARSLVNDKEMVPIRGQIWKVRAPWIREFAISISGSRASYVLPNQDFVVLGGTKQENNEDLNASLKDKEWIINSTKRLFPSLELAKPIADWVGLRPARSEVRLEKEVMEIPDGRRLKVVHNYGHGGSGLTVHWGCAMDSVKLVAQYLKEMNIQHTSKL